MSEDSPFPTPSPRPSGWQPPSVEALQALLPQYEITGMLGRGGMGAVYKGRQINLDRPVAIKILSAEMDDSDLGYAARFKNEARAMAMLNHPGIVAVFDFGEVAGHLLYIVMEYVEGTDVSRMISEQGRLHTEHAMAITAHVCDALAYAHECGIIHRDIKPANIMVGYDGVVKVADFGLAKVNGAGQSAALTRTGLAMGTLHFMAPEALEFGVTVDHRADIYAVGVMLYQMLTGKLPQGMFLMPSVLVPGLDPRYDRIVSKAMYEDREARYPSADEMRADLDGLLTQPVVKVEEGAKEAPAALPTRARPQRPDRARPEVKAKPIPARNGNFLLWSAIVAVASVAVWLSVPKNEDSTPPKTAEGTKSTAPAPKTSGVSPPPVTGATRHDEATKDRPFVNSLGMKFVPIPASNVLFCIHETRRQDYAVYAAESPGVDTSWKAADKDGTPVGHEDTHPVVNVSWDDAQAFCDWLSKKEGKRYRLPTDAEWSLAVALKEEGAGKSPDRLSGQIRDVYPWGSTWPPTATSGNLRDTTTTGKFADSTVFPGMLDHSDGFASTAPVMSFPPNVSGLYDLEGNISEWCEDWTNPTEERRTARGGSFLLAEPGHLLSSRRFMTAPTMRYVYYGFRCVIERDSKTQLTKTVPVKASISTPVSTLGPVSEAESLKAGWRSVFEERPELIEKMGIRDVGDGWWSMNSGLTPLVEARNAALRLRAKTTFNLVAKWTEPPPEGSLENFGFQVSVSKPSQTSSSSPIHSRIFGGWITTLRDGRPSGYKPIRFRTQELPPDQEYELELRAYGGNLTVVLNGQVEKVDTNVTLSGNWFAIHNQLRFCLFETLEWRPLDEEGNPLHETTPSSGTKAAGLTVAPLSNGSSPAVPANPELLALEQQYLAAIKQQVTPAVAVYSKTLVTSYRNALDRATKAPGVASTEVSALNAEIGRISAYGSIPDIDPPETTPTIIKLRTTYREAVSTFSAQKAAPFEAFYDQQVAEMRAKWAKDPTRATKDEPFTNRLGMKFVPVPGTDILMCIHEVRYKDWEFYAGTNAGVSSLLNSRQSFSDTILPQLAENHPVMSVTYDNAVGFCQWLSKRERMTYRLASDREWSYAVGIGPRESWTLGTTPETRSGTLKDVFPWGVSWPPPKAAGNFADTAFAESFIRETRFIEGYTDGFPALAPVMSFPPNTLGIFDLEGNITEWVEDWWNSEQKDRTGRGGTFASTEQSRLASSWRGNLNPSVSYSNAYWGFRVVLEP